MMPATSSQLRAAQRWTTVLDGAELRRLRRARGLSQERLAGRAGISLTAVVRLERQSRAACRTRTLARLAAALGEDPAVLATGQLVGGRGAPVQPSAEGVRFHDILTTCPVGGHRAVRLCHVGYSLNTYAACANRQG